ncbi:hypothetical protein CANARDRAFT_191409, partial [[Candida] arabinofermentans NRRL YB-2248]
SFIITVIIALIILLITSIIFNKDAIFNKKQPTYLIIGPKNSGKTNLYELLTSDDHKLPLLTVSSIEPNYGTMNLKSTGESFKLIDFPGNLKLESLYLYPFLKDSSNLFSLKGIIYLIDSTQFGNNGDYCNLITKDLMKLLPFTESIPNGIDICIFCNKSDLFTSLKSTKIKELLCDEFTKLQKLNLRNLNEISNDDDDDVDNINGNFNNLTACFENGVFKFELLEGNVSFVEGNLFKDKMDGLLGWIDEKACN